MGSADDQFCLRWNDFQQCIKSTFQELREEKDFMDVTISCDGEQVKAHKVILSACSVTFRNLLKKNPAQNPVIVLWVRIVNSILNIHILIYYFIVQDVAPRDLTSILDFMYQGEVNVKQDHLNSFLAVAEKLRVRGLCQNNSDVSSSSAPKQASHSEKPKPPRPSDTSFTEPAIKRSRPSLAQESQDDDIEELPGPVVKQEVGEPLATPTPGSSSRVRPAPLPGGHAPAHDDYQVAQSDQYDEGEYGDYEGYEDEMGYGAEGAIMDPSQAKGKKTAVWIQELIKVSLGGFDGFLP